MPTSYLRLLDTDYGEKMIGSMMRNKMIGAGSKSEIDVFLMSFEMVISV